jgi:predicted secreted protein
VTALALCACTTEPTRLSDVACEGAGWAVTVPGPAAQVELRVGERMALRLPVVLGSGSAWLSRDPAHPAAIDAGPIRLRPDGMAGQQCMTIRGIAEGQGAVVLEYRRAQDSEPVQSVDLRMDVRVVQ